MVVSVSALRGDPPQSAPLQLTSELAGPDLAADWTIEMTPGSQSALERLIGIFRVRGLTIRWLEYQPGGAEGGGDVLRVSTLSSPERAERVRALVERVVAVTTAHMIRQVRQ